MPTEQPPIRYGMFVMPIHDPNKPLAQCFDEDLELAVHCDRAGYDEFWVGEHHSSTYENIISPEIFIAKAMGMTESIRMGPAPVCLQYHHPLHVAGRLAFLDHLSHGRLNLCFGVGAIPTDAEMFDIPPKEGPPRVAEAMEAILKVWTSDPPYEIRGKYWNLSLKEHVDLEMGLGVLQKPLQRPYPPISIPCISRNSPSIKMAAARGFQPFSHHMVSDQVLANQWETYTTAAQAAGKQPQQGDWKVSRNIFVAETTEEARRLARTNSMGSCIEYIMELSKRHGPGLVMWKRDSEMTDAECNLDYFMDDVVIAGDPDEVTRQIIELRGRIGPFGTLVLVAHDWDDKQAWLRNLDLFAAEVMPALNKQLAGAG